MHRTKELRLLSIEFSDDVVVLLDDNASLELERGGQLTTGN